MPPAQAAAVAASATYQALRVWEQQDAKMGDVTAAGLSHGGTRRRAGQHAAALSGPGAALQLGSGPQGGLPPGASTSPPTYAAANANDDEPGAHGTGDKTVPIDPTARAAARGIAGAKLVEYDGEPHGLFATAPDRLNQDLIAFLRS